MGVWRAASGLLTESIPIMKKILRLFLFLSALGWGATAHALTFTFSPTPSDLGDLDHHNATTWGIATAGIPANQVITGAKLKIKRLWDWKVEPNDTLFIRLLDTAAIGVKTFVDNTSDTVISDYFSGQGILLTTWTDPIGGYNGAFATNFTYTFSASQLATLITYANNATLPGKAAFGFGFDPDCHYYNDGITFEITTAPVVTVPDSGSAVLLLGSGLLAIAVIRRRLTAPPDQR